MRYIDPTGLTIEAPFFENDYSTVTLGGFEYNIGTEGDLTLTAIDSIGSSNGSNDSGSNGGSGPRKPSEEELAELNNLKMVINDVKDDITDIKDFDLPDYASGGAIPTLDEFTIGESLVGLFKLGGLFKRGLSFFAKNSVDDSLNLIKELGKKGIKHSPDDIVAIAKNMDDKIVFLEQGNTKAGLKHILNKHGDEFVKAGISQSDVPDFIMKAVTKGNVVGVQGRGRPIYEVMYKDVIQRVAVSVSDNGFIVGANMSSFP